MTEQRETDSKMSKTKKRKRDSMAAPFGRFVKGKRHREKTPAANAGPNNPATPGGTCNPANNQDDALASLQRTVPDVSSSLLSDFSQAATSETPAQAEISPFVCTRNAVNTSLEDTSVINNLTLRVSPNQATAATSAVQETGRNARPRQHEVCEHTGPPTTEEIPDISDVLPVQLLGEVGPNANPFFWAQAYASFESKHGRKDVALMRMGESQKNEQIDLAEVLGEKKRGMKNISPSLERAIHDILTFKDIAVAAAQFDPTRAAPTIVRGVCNILQSFLGVSDLDDELAKYVAEMTNSMLHWGNLEYLYLRGDADTPANNYTPMEQGLVDLYECILEFKVELSRICELETFASFLKASGRSAKLKQVHGAFKLADSSCRTALEDCQKKLDGHIKIRDWISEDKSVSAYLKMRDLVDLRKFPGCGQWLLDSESYQIWDDGSSEVLCISGTVGTGKTSLITRVIQQHEKASSMYRDRRFAYFYCTRGSSDQTAKHIMKSILRQLVYDPKDHTIARTARDMFNRLDRPPFESMSQCEELFEGLMDSEIKVRIVIDALDECEHEDRTTLLKTLQELHSKAQTPNQCQLLLSGRAHVEIPLWFSAAVQINVDCVSTQREMRDYIDRSISTSSGFQRPVMGKCPELESRLVKILCARARGMFIWVKLQLAVFLNPKTRIDRPATFRAKLDKLEKENLSGADSLREIYTELLQLNSEEHSDEREITTFIFQWMICTPEPLDMHLLTQALDALSSLQSSENPGRSIDSCVKSAEVSRYCRNFVTEGSRYNGRLEFTHASVPEFLETQYPSLYNKTACHIRMATVCIQYLMNPYKGKNFSNPKTAEYLRAHAMKIQAPHWARHAFEFFMRYCKGSIDKSGRRDDALTRLLVKWVVAKDSPATFADWCRHVSGDDPRLELDFLIENDQEDLVAAILASPLHDECCLSPDLLEKSMNSHYSSRFASQNFKATADVLAKYVIDNHATDRTLVNCALYVAANMSPIVLAKVLECVANIHFRDWALIIRALKLTWPLSSANVNTIVEAFSLLLCKVCEFHSKDADVIRPALAVADKIGDKDLILQLLRTALDCHSQDVYVIGRALAVADKFGDKDLILQLLRTVLDCHSQDAYVIHQTLAVADKIGDKDLILQLLRTVLDCHFRNAYIICQALAVADKIGDKNLILQLLGKVLGCYSTDDEIFAGSVFLVTEELEGPIRKNYKGFIGKNEQEYRNLHERRQVIIEALKIAEKIEDEQMTGRLLDAIVKFHIYDTILVCQAVVVALRVGNNEIVTQLLEYTPYPATWGEAVNELSRDYLDEFADWESCQNEEYGRITPDSVRRATLLFKGLL